MACYLYRGFDADGVLLYIGLSAHPRRRLSQHSRRSTWWLEIASITVTRYPSRGAAGAAELRAIHDERPRFNIKGNGGNGTRVQAIRNLRRVVRRRRASLEALEKVRAERDRAIRAAIAANMSRAQIVEITGLSPARVDQIRRG